MTRSFAGVFGVIPGAGGARLCGALAPHRARTHELGPLRVAYSGSAAPATGPLCLLAGHIDNAATLRAELQARTVPGDAVEDLLSAAYLRWDVELPSRLRGDFVLLIWDAPRERGLIARDQLGVRCLYVHERAGTLSFATEVHELLAILPSRPPPDRAGVAHWIAASARPGAGTLYEGVSRLAPGSMLVLKRTRARACARVRRYWAPTYEDAEAMPREQACALTWEQSCALPYEAPLNRGDPDLGLGLRGAIGHAVGRRLASAGQTGVLMSGGLDSASVAALAAAQRPGGVLACSGEFPEHSAVDESELIAQLRSALRLESLTAQAGSGGLLASALESQRRWQLPLLSWGDFWTLPLLRAAASAGVQMVLGGDGGDELFAVRAYLLADRLLAAHPRQALALARQLPGAGRAPSRMALSRVTAALAIGGAVPYRAHAPLRRAFARPPFARASLPRWLTPAMARAVRECDDPHAWKRLRGPRWWAHAAHGLARGIEETGLFELHRHRAALAGLEARHPLLDLDLVELVLRQPPLSTFDRDRNRPALRAAMAGLLPDAVRLRPHKALFDSLIVDTLHGPDRGAVQRLLCDPRAELGAYVDLALMRRALLTRPPAGMRESFVWMQHVWRLATAECWLRAQADPANDELDRVVDASPARVRLTRAQAQPAPFSTLTAQFEAVESRRAVTSPSLAGRSLGRKADISSRTKESSHG